MNDCLPVPVAEQTRDIDPVELALYVAVGAEMGAIPEIVMDLVDMTLEPESIEEVAINYGKEISPV
jgi:hypothetical protein